MIVGDAPGSNLNVLHALAACAAIQAKRGSPFVYPGRRGSISQALDVDLLPDALVWAANAGSARNNVFNIENGEVLAWRDLWPIVESACGVATTGRTLRSIVQGAVDSDEIWAALVTEHRLVAPANLRAFLGGSIELADLRLGAVVFEIPHGLMNGVKLSKAGFMRHVDSEELAVRWLRRFRNVRLLPLIAQEA